ncbi:helix-turn-helix transcriptional regulator [Halorhabdus salina]
MPSSCELDNVLSKRSHHLQALIEQPRPKSELEDIVECSRSTLNRSLRELADVGLGKYEDGIWKPTLLGRYSYQARADYRERLRNLSEAASLLQDQSYECSLSSQFLEGAEVHTAESSVPDAVLQTLFDFEDSSKKVCVATPTLTTGFARQIHHHVVDGAIESLEIVFTEKQLEKIRASFPEFIPNLLGHTGVDLFRSSIPFSYGIWLVDSIKAAVVIFTEQGVRGVLVNEKEKSVEWATTQYEQVKHGAEGIENVWERTVPRSL